MDRIVETECSVKPFNAQKKSYLLCLQIPQSNINIRTDCCSATSDYAAETSGGRKKALQQMVCDKVIMCLQMTLSLAWEMIFKIGVPQDQQKLIYNFGLITTTSS